jgi:type IV pilus assembly protein PilC
MLTYKYSARDSKTGELIKAEVQADSELGAASAIKASGLSPIDIMLVTRKGAGTGWRNRVKAKDRILFARQLSTLINAGLPLVQSLRSVNDQTESKSLQSVIGQIITSVEAGGTLSAALDRYPRVFNKVFTSLIAAGETSGTLDKALERVAYQQEKDAEILSKIRGALAYPIIVLVVMVGVVAFMVITVLPQVKSIYSDIPGKTLPLVTRILLAVSEFSIKYWWVVIIATGFLVFATTRWARTGPGKDVIDRLKMKMWPIGPLFMKMYMARFARTATTLVASGVPLLQVLEISADAVNNVHIERSLVRASEKVRGGKALSDAITNDKNFLILVPNMLKIGEQSGSIDKMLEKIADYFEKEVDNQIKTISTIIEPLMMVMLGATAFVIVAAILLPIYSLAGSSGFK